MSLATLKLCECGCGGLAPLAPQTDRRKGYVKGYPMKYISHHYQCVNGKSGKTNPNWKGGKIKRGEYELVLLPNHPRARTNGYVLVHILQAEAALGKLLPSGVEVHHHDSTQLVICQNQAYHMYLHQRARAFKTSGHADWRKCSYCKIFDAQENLLKQRSGNGYLYIHRSCSHEYEAKRRQKRKGIPGRSGECNQ